MPAAAAPQIVEVVHTEPPAEVAPIVAAALAELPPAPTPQPGPMTRHRRVLANRQQVTTNHRVLRSDRQRVPAVQVEQSLPAPNATNNAATSSTESRLQAATNVATNRQQAPAIQIEQSLPTLNATNNAATSDPESRLQAAGTFKRLKFLFSS